MQNEDNKNFAVTIKECFCSVEGKLVIAVNGNENVDLENTQLFQKLPGRHSLKLKQFCKVYVVHHNLLYL